MYKNLSPDVISQRSLGNSHPMRNPMNVENPLAIGHSLLHTKEGTMGTSP